MPRPTIQMVIRCPSSVGSSRGRQPPCCGGVPPRPRTRRPAAPIHAMASAPRMRRSNFITPDLPGPAREIVPCRVGPPHPVDTVRPMSDDRHRTAPSLCGRRRARTGRTRPRARRSGRGPTSRPGRCGDRRRRRPAPHPAGRPNRLRQIGRLLLRHPDAARPRLGADRGGLTAPGTDARPGRGRRTPRSRRRHHQLVQHRRLG